MDPLDERDLDLVRKAKSEHGARLRAFPNVCGIGVGLRRRSEQLTDLVCLRVYVRRKLPLSALQPGEVLPRFVGGVRVDVVESAEEFHAFTSRVDPVFPGVSIGNGLRRGSGTLGMTVFDLETGRDLLLSNWHVLCGQLDCRGEPAVQPGRADARPTGNVVGHLVRHAFNSRVDAAVADVYGFRYLLPRIREQGTPRRVAAARLGMPVRKTGRTTDATRAVVVDVDKDTEIDTASLGLGTVEFTGQLGIEGERASRAGDSGSVWLSERIEAVGLHFAGDGNRSATANPIGEVLRQLKVSLTRGVRLHELIEITADALD